MLTVVDILTKLYSGSNLEHHNIPSESNSNFPNIHGNHHLNNHQQNLPHLTNQHHMTNNNHASTNDVFNTADIEHQRRLKVMIH